MRFRNCDHTSRGPNKGKEFKSVKVWWKEFFNELKIKVLSFDFLQIDNFITAFMYLVPDKSPIFIRMQAPSTQNFLGATI